MWRQMLVDAAYQARVRRAYFSALLRANVATLVFFGVVAVGAIAIGTITSNWNLALFAVLLTASMPLLLRRAAGRAAGLAKPGTFVAYAVTPEGTLHMSVAAGTSTINPGYVARVLATPDCWLIALSTGSLVVVPRELIPDADAASLVRHLPGEFRVTPAVTERVRRPTS